MKKKWKYIAFNKPYGCLCQFTGEPGDLTLSEYGLPKDVYPVGRLDKDSEGLLILTDDGVFNQRVANPKSKKEKTYWIQVEKIPSSDSIKELEKGVEIKGKLTLPCKARLIDPKVQDRDPPIRYRKNIPDSWLEIKLKEGRNRQVRRMSAKIGHPTLRLIRVAIGKLKLGNLGPGEWKHIDPSDVI
tara:strand:+ start:1328 stop:1885 length:558 start_codon:yes stop_codon:yes gene_type:complete